MMLFWRSRRSWCGWLGQRNDVWSVKKRTGFVLSTKLAPTSRRRDVSATALNCKVFDSMLVTWGAGFYNPHIAARKAGPEIVGHPGIHPPGLTGGVLPDADTALSRIFLISQEH